MRLSGLAASLATVALLVVVHDVGRELGPDHARHARVHRRRPAAEDVPKRCSSGARSRSSSRGCSKRSRCGPASARVARGRGRRARERDPRPRASARSRSSSAPSSSGVGGGALRAPLRARSARTNFYLTITFTMVAMLVVGGAESLSGAVVGSVIVVDAPSRHSGRSRSGIDVARFTCRRGRG